MSRAHGTNPTSCTVPAAAVMLALSLIVPLACAGATPAAPEGEAATAVADTDLIAMLPQAATAIGWVDFDALRQSSIYGESKFEEDMIDFPSEDLEEFIAETGIDPRRDIHRLAFAGLAFGEGGDEGAFVATVSFDRDRVTEALADRPQSEYRGHTLYLVDDDEDEDGDDDGDEDGDDDGPGYVTILDDQTLGLGSETGIHAVIDTVGGGENARANAELMRLAEDDAAGTQAWMVVTREAYGEALSQNMPEGAPVPTKSLEKIVAVVAGANLGEGVDLGLTGHAATEEDARMLGDSLSGFLAMGKMMLQNDKPELFSILDRGLSIDSDGTKILIRATLSLEDIETLRGLAEDADKSEEEEAAS